MNNIKIRKLPPLSSCIKKYKYFSYNTNDETIISSNDETIYSNNSNTVICNNKSNHSNISIKMKQEYIDTTTVETHTSSNSSSNNSIITFNMLPYRTTDNNDNNEQYQLDKQILYAEKLINVLYAVKEINIFLQDVMITRSQNQSVIGLETLHYRLRQG